MIVLSNSVSPRILAVGAHPDDIELGAAGFIARMRRECKAEIYFAILTYGTLHWQNGKAFKPDTRVNEATKAFARLLGIHPRSAAKRLRFGGFADCGLGNARHKPIRFLERVIADVQPTMILTHAPGDIHDDHRQAHNATLSAARQFHGCILLYQSTSTIPNEFGPNFFVALSDEDFQVKMEALERHSSQQAKDFMSQTRVSKMAEAWAAFHRTDESKLEAFVLHKSFW